MKKVIRDGKVAVLVSPGYGAGWYSWNEKHTECLFEPEIVTMVLDGRDPTQIEKKADELYGYSFYAGGARDLEVAWLEPGTVFLIREYDGYEHIEINNEMDWVTA